MSRFQTIRKVPIRKRCHYATAPLAPVPGVGTLCPSPTHGLQMSLKDKSTLELIALRADIDAAIAVIEREKALRASAKAKQATKPKPPRTPKPKRAPEQKTPERPKRLTHWRSRTSMGRAIVSCSPMARCGRCAENALSGASATENLVYASLSIFPSRYGRLAAPPSRLARCHRKCRTVAKREYRCATRQARSGRW